MALYLLIFYPMPAWAFTPVRGHANLGQELELQALESQAGSEVAVEINDSGSAHYLASTDIAPGCAAPAVATAQDAEAVVACFFQRYPALFSEGVEDTRTVPRTAVSIGAPSPDGVQVVRLHQPTGRRRRDPDSEAVRSRS